MVRYPRNYQLAVLAVLSVFAAVMIGRHWDVAGTDLSSSYVGCRILANHQGTHLFAHDDDLFNVEEDPVWVATAERTNFAPIEDLHPYVQTPLWAWSLQPLCTHTDFPEFDHIFLVAFMLSISALIWLCARYWTRRLYHPLWIALLCAGYSRTEPFKYAISLVQTHILFLLLAVAALLLARRGHPILAGVLLALTASVKITPGFLLLYWLTSRQWKAAFSFLAASAALVVGAIAAVGTATFLAYLHELQWVSGVLLVAFNNQSLAATWMSGRVPSDPFVWQIYSLPPTLKFVGTLLCLAAPVFGGWLDWRSGSPAEPPYGAIFTLLATTLCTPIAWNHYFILLILPAMFLMERAAEDFGQRQFGPAVLWLTLFAAIVLLNLYPVSFGAVLMVFKAWSIERSQFYAGLLALVALLLLRRVPAGVATTPSLPNEV